MKHHIERLIIMSKIAVVYWSGTGNTETMANAVLEGALSAGSDASLFTAGQFSGAQAEEYDAIAFGCPAMGAEELEDGEFEPMFSDCEKKLSGKRIGLFGSYGWGDGQWMRDWEVRCQTAGADLVSGGVIANDAPGDEETAACKALGAAL